jgi:hypothetical protein
MRYSRLLLLLFVLLTTSSAQTPKPSGPPPFRITISSVQPSSKLGEPVWIHIVLKNITKEMLPVPEIQSPASSLGELNYNIEVLDNDGAPVPITKLGREIMGGPRFGSGEYLLKHLEPGDEIGENADLKRVAEISAPGDYSVRVKRADPRYGNLHIKSNTIVVHITP